MKNIHILPTDKPSRLFIDIEDNKLKITIPIGGEHMMNQHIYITNDEEIKEGDYCISHLNIIDEGKIHNSQTIFNPKTKEHLILLQSCKKIILTTDTDLIKDGVQTIDDEFLEWFVKNPSYEEVEIDSKLIVTQTEPLIQHQGNKLVVPHKIKYKIILPKEEPDIMSKPKQETLEEAAERYANQERSYIEANKIIEFLTFKWCLLFLQK